MNEYDVHFLLGNLLKEQKYNEWLEYKVECLSRSYEALKKEINELKEKTFHKIIVSPSEDLCDN